MPGNEHNVRKRKAASTDSASSSSSPANTATAASKASAKPQKRSRQLPFCMNLTITVLVAFGSVFALVFFYPSEDDYDCRTFRLPVRPPLKGASAVNEILKNSEYLLEDKIKGPESILVENGTIYTGTSDGLVVEIVGGEVERSIQFKDGPCGTYEDEPICGRPLGIRRLNSEELIVADAYLGIYTVNFNKEKFKKVFDAKREVDGEPLKFLNDLDVVNDDLVIFSDSSSRWQRRDYFKILMEGIPNGRVFSLVPSTGEVKVLMKDVFFANGVQLFPDKQSFLVAETAMARIKRHWIAGSKKGTTEVFAENLPGLPDNIRLSDDGKTFWVGMANVRRHQQFSLIDFVSEKPVLRKFLLKLIPSPYWSVLYSKLRTRHAMIVELDQNGQIVSSAHDTYGVLMTEASQVTDDGEYLYMGSFHANFIAKLHKSYLRSTN